MSKLKEAWRGRNNIGSRRFDLMATVLRQNAPSQGLTMMLTDWHSDAVVDRLQQETVALQLIQVREVRFHKL